MVTELQRNLITNPIGTFFGEIFSHTFSKVFESIGTAIGSSFKAALIGIPKALFGNILGGIRLTGSGLTSGWSISRIQLKWTLPSINISNPFQMIGESVIGEITSNITDSITGGTDEGFNWKFPDIGGLLAKLFSTLKELGTTLGIVAILGISLFVVFKDSSGRKRNSKIPSTQERTVGLVDSNVNTNDPGVRIEPSR